MYTPCLGRMRWVAPTRAPGAEGFWGCSLFPNCGFRYFPPQPVDHPQVALEILSEQAFKVRVFNCVSVVCIFRAWAAQERVAGVQPCMALNRWRWRSFRKIW